MKARIVLSGIWILFRMHLSGQDIHFSQFWEPQNHMNPATIGNFDGNIKLAAQYRNQWSQFNTPLVSAYAEGTIKLQREKDYWAFSLSMMRDQMGFLTYFQHRVSVSAAYQSQFSRKFQGAAGFQVGTRLTAIDYNSLTWDRQWDPSTGNFQNTLPNGESFTVDNVYTPYLNLGLSGNIVGEKIMHSFDLSSLYILPNNARDFVFYQPFLIHLNFHSYIPYSSRLMIMPKLGIIYTSAAHSIHTALLLKYKLDSDQDLYGGLGYRWGPTRNPDGFIPVVGYRIKRLKLGVSYDFVTSGINQEQLKNVWEISIQYIFKFPKNKYYSIDCLRL